MVLSYQWAMLMFYKCHLIKNWCNFFSIESDGEEGLLVVVGGNVEDEEIGTTHGSGEDAGIGVHASSNIGAATLQ